MEKTELQTKLQQVPRDCFSLVEYVFVKLVIVVSIDFSLVPSSNDLHMITSSVVRKVHIDMMFTSISWAHKRYVYFVQVIFIGVSTHIYLHVYVHLFGIF